jgi:hypothetical protein
MRSGGSRRTVARGMASILSFLAIFCLAAPPFAYAASCITQSEMTLQQRHALEQVARTLTGQIQEGNIEAVKTRTIPAVAAHFDGIAELIQNQKPLIEKATITVDNLYALDAPNVPPGSSGTDFYCGQPLVSMHFTDLPPGSYALVIVHATGTARPQQITFILSQDDQKAWMLAGLISRPMAELGHGGIWYWDSARHYASLKMDWDAWLYYRIADRLLNPIDVLRSPNIAKLQQETEKVTPAGLAASGSLPLMAYSKNYSLTAINTSTAFGALDLDVHYAPDAAETTLLHDPGSARRQAIDIMAGLLKQHPELQAAFHGIWVHADQGASSLFALELPMKAIAEESAPIR